ncbi:MAG: FKBP-type peptidyl-prolyl cis-trans isomerase [Lautropia sp.]|nr:FKBP-type peptidyl-prolyl cis-trans isomerase [Lautropia sp.]
MSDRASSSSAVPSEEASAAPAAVVGPRSFLTLHYRLTLPDTGADVINTFEGKPATLQLGIGQMAEALESCLLGLADGDHRVFDLAPGQAFGPRNPELIQRVSRAMLEREGRPDEIGTYQPGDLVEFPAPDGGAFAGVLKSQDEQGAVFDFNHPLAGKAVRFEVRILGVL